ncbi:hypothetical protein K9N68_01245 [Kovacikia minuta CCNUW1]|uniref:hypothetical protein n=1 Tax=Kovacikia minuta TaxID=2931930 RepID=UPI001CCBCFDB|nr:hypothetical protein [Kovacikia minuta]UBF26666.1 hypothetical protein K9N68_01245 [Kovacikia minuta CCNUW1]
MSASRSLPQKSVRRRKNLWFERAMAIVASINLVLVLFDLTYVPLRNFWLLGNVEILFWNIPVSLPPPPPFCRPSGDSTPDKATFFTQCYDWVKGIEPHRDTETYLNTVNQLEQQVEQVGLNSLKSPTVKTTLQDLQQLSAEMIETNPFEAVGKSGTLEKIKNSMRDHMRREVPKVGGKISATQAFALFWSAEHLTSKNWQQEMKWFNTNIRPLMQTNYYRSISENGDFTNKFWILDAPFWSLFVLEFLGRTFYLSRRYTGISWLGAMTWRWYDIPLIVPFGFIFHQWAWLRAISVAFRLDQAELVDMKQIRAQAKQGFVGTIAGEVTETVVMQVIDQVQGAIRRGDVAQWLLRPPTDKWVAVNDVDELAEIVSLMTKLMVYQVLPKIQPELEAVLQHTRGWCPEPIFCLSSTQEFAWNWQSAHPTHRKVNYRSAGIDPQNTDEHAGRLFRLRADSATGGEVYPHLGRRSKTTACD